jgi:hypothetical protein
MEEKGRKNSWGEKGKQDKVGLSRLIFEQRGRRR